MFLCSFTVFIEHRLLLLIFLLTRIYHWIDNHRVNFFSRNIYASVGSAFTWIVWIPMTLEFSNNSFLQLFSKSIYSSPWQFMIETCGNQVYCSCHFNLHGFVILHFKVPTGNRYSESITRLQFTSILWPLSSAVDDKLKELLLFIESYVTFIAPGLFYILTCQ